MLYLDSSAVLKRYVNEPGSDMVVALMEADASWLTAQHTLVEVRRNLARLLSEDALVSARGRFVEEWALFNVALLDETLLEIASTIAETTLARSVDAIHLAAATRFGVAGLTFVTFDGRQADIAKRLGFAVVGSA